MSKVSYFATGKSTVDYLQDLQVGESLEVPRINLGDVVVTQKDVL